jgi:DNA-binding CsgD family transcriptional regulator
LKRSHALAHLRHLSCLGLGGEIVVPRMLVVLRDLIGANFAGFHWTDPNGRSTNVHATEITSTTIDLFVNHYERMQRPGELSVDVLAKGPMVTGNIDRWYEAGSLERTVAFNEIFVPERSTIVLDAVVRSGRTPRGVLLFGRGRHDSAFRPTERRLLEDLVPWFLHALAGSPANSAGFVPDDERTVLLCDGSGRVLASDPNGVQVLLHAIMPYMARGASSNQPLTLLPPELRELCVRARDVCAGRPTAAPITRISNCWGAFSFQAHALTGRAASGNDDLVALTISREQPREIRILERLRTTALSPRQRELALHLGVGKSPEEIRAHMSISRATYRAYVERIYTGLDVHNKAELALALSA